MRLGLLTPVVMQLPGAAAPWEASAGPDDLVRVAEEADRLGYAHLTCSEHVAVPAEGAAQRGRVYWDPLATLSFLAARTRRLRLVTNVLVLGYHHPLEIAKRYGTLDALSGGRMVLGVGVGTLEEEFDLLGAPFADRGARADDALRALRASLSQPVPAYRGEFYRFSGMAVEPHAVQDRVPIWVGGRTRRSLRRALTLADGWMPMALRPEECRDLLAEVTEDSGRPDGFDLVLGAGRPLDPIGDPDRSRATLGRLAEAGATVANASFVSRSVEHYLEQMETLMQLRDGVAG